MEENRRRNAEEMKGMQSGQHVLVSDGLESGPVREQMLLLLLVVPLQSREDTPTWHVLPRGQNFGIYCPLIHLQVA